MTHDPVTSSRRDLLKWTAGATAGVAVVPWVAPTAAGAAAAGAAGAAAGRRPISMAMHIHASASEGRGSMAAHLQQATQCGVDVVWWTDHDFRHQALGYREEIGFDAKVEPGVPGWEWTYRQEGVGPTEPSTDFVDDPRSADEAGKAMRVAATGEKRGWSYVLREATAYNYTYTRTLAGTELGLDVLLEQSGADALAVIRVQSSYLPASGGRGAGYYTVEYRLGGTEGRWTQDGGRSLVVGLPATPGSWQRLSLDPQADAAQAWPDILAGDLGLDVLQLGVRSRRSSRASVVYDRLRLRRRDTEGDAPLAAQRALMEQYADRYPAVTQHQGSEISLVRHLNVFGGALTLPDYGEVDVPSKDASLEATREAVDFAHDHGSLVTLNHPLSDEPGPVALGRMLIRERALGVDMLEVGVRSRVGQIVKAYDAAARNAVFLTATGTSDDHLGADWRGVKQRWVTSVWAGSTDEAELLGALGRGEAWFWDLKRWRGGSTSPPTAPSRWAVSR